MARPPLTEHYTRHYTAPMRTKLDEIVDEESGQKPFATQEKCDRIAERAFRHGVEQALFAEWGAQRPMTGLHIRSGAVHPAPAKEPTRFYLAPWCTDAAHIFGPCMCDRRKGERRRKHKEFFYGVRYHTKGLYTSEPDRRSGKERRRV